ncbi:MAG: globin domain-containing protein [Pirellulales bacterium]
MWRNVELLEAGFALASRRGPEFIDRFFQNLFREHPEIRPLFVNTDMPKQKEVLLAALTILVSNLRRPEVLDRALEDLGARHVDYGVTEEHYRAFGATLVDTMAEVAGEAWNNEYRRAWTEAFDAISERMLAGASAGVA